ncbi:alpha/beta hydrolase [Cohnella boryungensis]|uniref:Alpha/beta hydrolase n=1 Tax=Cohnella boryungensis TaxID=768479 RepID=A0ABV8S3L2_9BACL
MRKTLRLLLKSAGILTIAIGLFLVIVFVVNLISNKSEEGRIEAYGQYVQVDGKNMNVMIQGSGEETVVLLPGYGTAAPALDFKLLMDELASFYKVVAIEPFGYGLSDETDKVRSTENIVGEVHEALRQLQIERYILMGHSIAGIYGLDYANKYPNEVSAFVGIDSSVPNQPGMDVKLPIKTFRFLKQSGLLRLIKKVSGDPYASLAFDDRTKEQMRLISNKNGNNATTMNEMKNIASNFKGAERLTFPADIPVLLFVQAINPSFEDWVPLHEEQVRSSVHGKVVPLDGEHYLHHTRSKEIAEGFMAFMKEAQAAR